MFARAGAFALANRAKRAQELKPEFCDSDDDNYVEPEKRNYLCTFLLFSTKIIEKTDIGLNNEARSGTKAIFFSMRAIRPVFG